MDKQIFTSVPIDDLMAAMRNIVREELAANPKPIGEKMDECITGKELCSFLGISEPTLIRWKAKGKIPFVQIGGQFRYNKNKVVSALESTIKKRGTKC